MKRKKIRLSLRIILRVKIEAENKYDAIKLKLN